MTDSTLPSLDALVPLSPLPWTSRVAGTSNGVRVYDGNGSPLPGCFSCGENDAVYEPEDGAVIAAAPAIVAALRAVLDAHYEATCTRGAPQAYCVDCGQAWPCATVRAIAAHIDTTPKETP